MSAPERRVSIRRPGAASVAPPASLAVAAPARRRATSSPSPAWTSSCCSAGVAVAAGLSFGRNRRTASSPRAETAAHTALGSRKG
eukprot:5524938-Prymnesium_polylepis.1